MRAMPLDYSSLPRHGASRRHIGARPAVQTIRQLDSLKSHAAALRRGGGSIALVPTMGALHAGHMALVAQAKLIADHVIVSIFVNPTQFGPNEDLDRYPRQEAADAALLAEAGVSVLWLPSVATMYPEGYATTVSVAGLGDGLCGAARPGHFDGVATVVAKLLSQVRPDIALFGEKDWQQLAIIRRMVRDLDLGIEIGGVAIVRDVDGLALSSRNAYLSDVDRSAALALPRMLTATAAAIEAGADIGASLAAAHAALLTAGFAAVDYVALVDADALTPLDRLDRDARLLAAARIGSTRLIDNVPVRTKN
jgi:pantoate--beta-alanine ligase